MIHILKSSSFSILPLTCPALALVTLLSGCLATPVSIPANEDEVFRLAALNSRSIALSVVADEHLSTGGNQYMLVVLPFGAVTVEAPSVQVERVLYRSLAVNGWKPIPTPDPSPSPSLPTLTVEIEEMDLSAFDLLISRRLVASVRLHGVLTRPGHLPLEARETGIESSFSRFGFEPQLQNSLKLSLERCVTELLRSLALDPPPHI